MAAAARGVAVLHGLGIVHRDLNPHNVLLHSDGATERGHVGHGTAGEAQGQRSSMGQVGEGSGQRDRVREQAGETDRAALWGWDETKGGTR